MAFNRTFVELKWEGARVQARWYWTFNRTFVELKWCFLRLSSASSLLLIEPLWNWNLRHDRKSRRRAALLIEPLWNWNFFVLTCCCIIDTFNRTFVELKWHWHTECDYCCIVLIEPLWNWNRPSRVYFIPPLMLLIEPLWNWNQCGFDSRRPDKVLLIEPLWNWNHGISIAKTRL